MGLHEWLIQRGGRYETSPELHRWLKVYEAESDKIARDFADKLSISRPVAVRAVAPTGTIGILGGTSTGIEPIFALYYARRSESFGNQFFKVFHSTVQAYLDKMQLTSDADKHDDLAELLPDYFLRTSHNINPEKRVKIQGNCQKFVDHSISSTVNLSEDIQPEVISDIYILGWKERLKGITIYRDGSRFPILSREGETTHFQEMKNKSFTIENEDGVKMVCNGEEVLKMPDGSLSTVYHYMRNSSTEIDDVLATTQFEEAV